MSFSSYRQRDLEAWERWNKSRSQEDLVALFKQMDGVIKKEIGRWRGVLSPIVLETEARRLAKQAFENYDPQRGVALATYLTNSLKKLSRLTYKHQNPTYIPEHQVLKVGTYQHAVRDLQDRHGRDPTNEELCDYLKWRPRDVSNLQKQMRSTFVESIDLPGGMFADASEDEGLLDYVYYDLNPQQKIIFEHTTGYGGKPILSNTEIRNKLGMTQGMFSYEKRKVVDKLKKITG